MLPAFNFCVHHKVALYLHSFVSHIDTCADAPITHFPHHTVCTYGGVRAPVVGGGIFLQTLETKLASETRAKTDALSQLEREQQQWESTKQSMQRDAKAQEDNWSAKVRHSTSLLVARG